MLFNKGKDITNFFKSATSSKGTLNMRPLLRNIVSDKILFLHFLKIAPLYYPAIWFMSCKHQALFKYPFCLKSLKINV